MADRSGNRLSEQYSSYLRSHANDPVDWLAWGREAFDRARELGRPVLVSIGYDSCHWCHVMQRESFRDPATARQLNYGFVSVKVDRELRPDVDQLYMTYVTLASGHGGWPMTVFVTPEGWPFFGGTYFPKKAPGGGASFGDVLTGVAEAFASDRANVESVGREALEKVAAVTLPRPEGAVDTGLVTSAAREIIRAADTTHGGIGGAPKFPQAPVLEFLLRFGELFDDDDARAVSRRWIEALVRQGTYDQVGGGLFRYSTDEAWLVPHFEKMLYDNAQLLNSLAMAYRLEPSDEVAAVIRHTAAFLDRDLGVGDGAYYSSLDAETGGIEGATYVWTWEELQEALSHDELEVAVRHLGITERGNWRRARNILTRAGGRTEDAEAVDAVLEHLLTARAQRSQPKVITNVLTEWNALAARGLLAAGEAIGDERIVDQGMRAVEWLRANACSGERVVHAPDDPSIADIDLLSDYAAVAAAFAVAAQVRGDDTLRAEAKRLLDVALSVFSSESILHMTGVDTDLPLRPIAYDDAPTSSGAAMLAEVHAMLRPTQSEELGRLLLPATGVARRAPFMAGTWLRIMTEEVARAET